MLQDVFEMRYAKMPDEPPPPEQPSSASQDTETGAGSSDEEQGESGHSYESEDEEPQSEGEDARQKIDSLQRQVCFFIMYVLLCHNYFYEKDNGCKY